MDKSKNILATADSACNVASRVLGHLPAPFSITGILFEAMRVQIGKINNAHGAWKDFYEELESFQAEITGELGYEKMFEMCIKIEDAKDSEDEKSIAAALKEEFERMNLFTASLMKDVALASPKFPDNHFRPEKYMQNLTRRMHLRTSRSSENSSKVSLIDIRRLALTKQWNVSWWIRVTSFTTPQ